MALKIDIDYDNLPKHVGIIMDGNGRWAQKRFKPRLFGHRAGIESLRNIIKTSHDIGIKTLTVYAFSTENWKRPKEEVDGLMKLLIEYFNREIRELNENGIKINVIGSLERLSESVKETIYKAIDSTEHNNDLSLNIAINYGGRDEIIKGIKELYKDLQNEKIRIDDVDEELFSGYMFTRGIDDPDLIIRTSGELRLSNFLIWQSAYSELYFTDVLWPDFTEYDYLRAIKDYQNRKRKFGGINL